jgi:molybdopterin molybdotransferase
VPPAEVLMSVEEAKARILSHVRPLPAETVALMDALGRVLAEDVYAPFDVPPMANSAMDGYAVRWADIQRAGPNNPAVLPIVGEVAAGHPAAGPLAPGQTMRIMTGAPVPAGCDTVVQFEETDEVERRGSGPASALREIGILSALPLGSNVRAAGGDVVKGVLIFSSGTLLRAAHLGVLASIGRGTVAAVRKPVVAIMATGDELREPGEPLGPGQIYNSNSYAIAAQVIATGAAPLVLPIARDTLDDLTAKLEAGLGADLFITSAGVSTGEYDLVKDVLSKQGSMDFWRVRMRPGKPLAFGLLRRADGSQVPHIGLPGNPVSSMVAFDQFARPAIFTLMGRPAPAHPEVTAVLDEAIGPGDGRRAYARAILSKRDGAYHVRLTGPQGSNLLTSMALANCLLVVPEDRDVRGVQAGERVQVQVLEGYEDLLA